MSLNRCHGFVLTLRGDCFQKLSDQPVFLFLQGKVLPQKRSCGGISRLSSDGECFSGEGRRTSAQTGTCSQGWFSTHRTPFGCFSASQWLD